MINIGIMSFSRMMNNKFNWTLNWNSIDKYSERHIFALKNPIFITKTLHSIQIIQIEINIWFTRGNCDKYNSKLTIHVHRIWKICNKSYMNLILRIQYVKKNFDKSVISCRPIVRCQGNQSIEKKKLPRKVSGR